MFFISDLGVGFAKHFFFSERAWIFCQASPPPGEHCVQPSCPDCVDLQVKLFLVGAICDKKFIDHVLL